MKRQSERKQNKRWGQIMVVHQDKKPIIFDLNERGKLIKKIRRQPPRDLLEELKKIPTKDITTCELLTNNKTCSNQPSLPSSSSNVDLNNIFINQNLSFTESYSTLSFDQNNSNQLDSLFFIDNNPSEYGEHNYIDEMGSDIDIEDSNLLDSLDFQY